MKRQQRRLLLDRSGWAGALVLVLGCAASLCGCLPSVKQACTTEFPEFDHKIEVAAVKIRQGFPEGQGRALASASNMPVTLSLSEDDKDRWQSWAEKRLKEAQFAMDIASTRPRLKREFSELADELVAFHGYTQLGRMDRMNASLAKAQDHLERARKLACEPGSASNRAATGAVSSR